MNELWRLRRSERYGACIDDVPCKLNNAKLSERTENGRDGNIATTMNLSEAEIHSLKVSRFRKGA